MQGIEQLLEQARASYASGDDEAAKARYLEILKLDACELRALSELAVLAAAGGYRSAARSAYLQAIRCHPSDARPIVSLGNLELQEEQWTEAQQHFESALRINGTFPEAHQGLGRALVAQGRPAEAREHFQRGFSGRALVRMPYRGQGRAVRVLLLVSTQFGNVAVGEFLDDRTFEVLALYVEFADPAQPLPEHDVIFNAIGDADLCADALQAAEHIRSRSRAPIINSPAQVAKTARLENAQRLATLPGIVTASTVALARADLARLPPGTDLEFPLLIRSPGFHMGSHFVYVDQADELAGSAAQLPGDQLLLMEYLDARGADGMTRKYRVMIIDGRLFPLHLAVASQWKVHYFSSAMSSELAFREEEQRFLEDMPATLGEATCAALLRVASELGLDYAGLDFGLRADGVVLLFEANATMVIAAPPPEAMWNYRRAAIEHARRAATGLVARRAAGTGEPPPAPAGNTAPPAPLYIV